MEKAEILEIFKRLQAIAHTGLVYASDEYNRERYGEVESLSHRLLHEYTGHNIEAIKAFYDGEKEYPTPKTDIRAVVFNDQNEILLAHEKDDNAWSLPGGWADIGYSPKEVVVKEVMEETGLTVEPLKLLAVIDKKCFPHPPEATYVYKYFIQCRITGGALAGAHDIHEGRFFAQDKIPALSEKRVLRTQIDLMFEYLQNPEKETFFN